MGHKAFNAPVPHYSLMFHVIYGYHEQALHNQLTLN